MKIIKPAVKVIGDNDFDIYQKIERCGRICYKSEANITENSSIKFVQNMIKHQHTAMLEHSHIYIRLSNNIMDIVRQWLYYNYTEDTNNNIIPYLNISIINDITYISGSVRTFINMFNSYFTSSYANCGMDSIYISLHNKYPEIFTDKNTVEPRILSNNDEKLIYIFDNSDEFILDVKNLEKANLDNIIAKHVIHTLVFICDRGISHEFVRHRPCSFAQESTRYCDYSKGKFGKEITVIKPIFFKIGSAEYNDWYNSCDTAEKLYFSLIKLGATAQEARSVLPNSLKTELVITATENEWQHILNLRYHGTTGKPHPQMVEIMSIAKDILSDISENRLI